MIGVQPIGSFRLARFAIHANGGNRTKYMAVSTALPIRPAAAAATRRYRFQSRFARACHTCRRYVRGATRAIFETILHDEVFHMNYTYTQLARVPGSSSTSLR